MADAAGGTGVGDPVTVEELLRSRLTVTIGGWRGALDTAAPTIAFVIGWSLTTDVRLAVLLAAAVLLLLLATRLLTRSTVRFLGYAVVATALAAFLALRTGRAQDAFLPGMIQTGLIGAAVAIANILRWPPFGFLVSAGDPELAETAARMRREGRSSAAGGPGVTSGDGSEEYQARRRADEQAVSEALTGWRRHEGIVAVASRLGWVVVGLDVVRLAVMVPLYLSEQIVALGVAKVVLGWPAYLAAVGVMGLILVRGHTPLDEGSPRAEP